MDAAQGPNGFTPNDDRDLNKNYATDYPILGDAKLVLRQCIEAVQDLGPEQRRNGESAAEVRHAKDAWLREWMPKLTSDEVPITPYRVIWEFMQTVPSSPAARAIRWCRSTALLPRAATWAGASRTPSGPGWD